MAKENQATLQSAIKNIQSRFGTEAISGKEIKGIERLSTGSIKIDEALGGGWAKGRIVELFGWESSGKSTLALHTAAQCQREGKAVGYIDMEHAMDLSYANSLGVNTEDESLWVMSQPDCGEDALEITRELLKVPEIGLIVVDSVTSLVPKAVIQGEAGDAKMALLARMMSQMIPTLVSPAKKNGTVVLFIGQLREKVGVMFGSPDTTTGGNALKFYASQRAQISKKGQTKDGDEITAQGAKIKVVKNKVSPPFKIAEVNIAFGIGIDFIDELIDMAVERDVVNKGGSWYSYEDTKLGQGKEAVKEIMRDNPELVKEIKSKL